MTSNNLSTEDLMDELRRRNPRSEAVWERANAVFPGGDNGGMRYFKPFPVYAAKANGGRIWDIDGNEYVDICMAYGAHILGHAPAPIVQALHQQMSDTLHYVIPFEREVEFAEKFIRTSPSSERIVFCNSGTEATLKAITVARAFTGKNRIAKFEGAFHGSHEYSQWSVLLDPWRMGPEENPNLVPGVLGMPRSAKEDMLLLPFNHERAFELIEENAGDLAVVMTEPILHAYGVPFDKEFLVRLREVTQRCGVLLMFDEVVTKYRLGIGGGEAYFGVTPDLIAFGKAIGGGLPIGAVGFREDIIMPLVSGWDTVELGGTFSGNAMTVTAANAMLDYLLENPEVYPLLESRGNTLREEFNSYAEKHGYPATIVGIGSLFRTLLSPPPIRKPRDSARENGRRVRDFNLLLRQKGVFVPYPARTCYFSTAHTDADLEFVIKAHQEALKECMEIDRERQL